MKLYNIITGNLYTDLDNPYDEENNKIDVYSSVYWTAKTKKEYEKKEKIIEDWKFENELVKCHAWCDIGGYNYWVIQEQEDNYVSIDVYLKKPATDYTQKEMQEIRDIIIKADQYFEEHLI